MEVLIIAVLILLNGVFALSEIALVSSRKQRIEQRAAAGSRGATAALELMSNPEGFLSSIQVGITLIGIVSGAYGGTALADDIRPLFLNMGVPEEYAQGLSFGLIVSLITYFSIVIGELIPKTLALSNPEKFAVAVAPFIRVFSRATAPLVYLLSLSTRLFNSLLRIRENNDEGISEEEIRYLLRMAGRDGRISREEVEIHDNIFSFLDLSARSMMTRRHEVEWIRYDASPEEIAAVIARSTHSKFPVFDRTIDNVLGVLNARVFLESMASGPITDLASILDEPLFFPEHATALQIIRVFKQKRQYFGVVVDEYGAFKGILTLHDLMEFIVGDLPSLDECGEDDIIVRSDGSLLVSGATPVAEINRYLNETVFTERPELYTTLAGFLLHRLQVIPPVGETLEYEGTQIEIVDIDGNRIDKVILKR